MEQSQQHSCVYPHCELRSHEAKSVFREHCIERHATMKEDIANVDKKIDRVEKKVLSIESRDWKIAGAIIVGLASLLMQFFNKPDTNAIAAQVIQALKHP